MEKEIALLIYSYVKNNKKIDNTFINKAINIIIKNYNLEEYIKGIQPLKHKTVYARYNRANKTIYINYAKLHDYLGISKELNIFDYKITNYYEYILFIQLLLHEVMHAKQYKQSETYKEHLKLIAFSDHTDTDLFTSEDIILYSEINAFESLIEDIESKNLNVIKGYIEGYKLCRQYEKLYDYSPSERMASIDSTKTAANIATILNDEPTTQIMLLENYEFCLCGYNTVIKKQYITEPTRFYLNSINSNQYWNQIQTLSLPLTNEEKIRLGLKVQPEQLYQLSNKSRKLLLQLKKQ